MMRLRFALLVGLVCWAGAARAQSLLGNAQDGQDNSNTVVVPPAPPIVAAPPAAPVVQPAPLPQPPGLVETPLPPPNSDAGAAAGAPVDNGQPAAPTAGQAAAGQAPSGQAPAAAAAQAPTAPAPDTSASLPPPPDNAWVPEHTAEIGILDKVDGGASTVSVPVGGQTVVGDLQINVLACETKPPTDVPDDAIFVAIQPANGSNGQSAAPAPEGSDPQSEAALFRGWMVRSVPGATVVGDGSETLRVVGCS